MDNAGSWNCAVYVCDYFLAEGFCLVEGEGSGVASKWRHLLHNLKQCCCLFSWNLGVLSVSPVHLFLSATLLPFHSECSTSLGDDSGKP